MTTEQHRAACEVREWRRLAVKHGRGWWSIEKSKIKSKRGEAALSKLIAAMNDRDQR